jgi:hypothetical protein
MVRGFCGETQMQEQVLIGKEKGIVATPWKNWEQALTGRVPLVQARLEFMSESHHLVRNFVVKELPQTGKPLSPELISRRLNLPLERVNSILEDLEKNLTFLYRNDQGSVAWAYPVTADETPHGISFSTGERINAA